MSTDNTEFLSVVKNTAHGSRLYEEEAFTQHGDTSCLLHSIAVAYYSYRLAKKLGSVGFCLPELIRGALLHDYFLYDWHENAFPPNGLHGYSHPYTAWQNASRDFTLTERECDIIRKHMFPLTLTKVPKYRESVVVMLTDKWCSLLEVFGRRMYQNETVQAAYKIVLAYKTT